MLVGLVVSSISCNVIEVKVAAQSFPVTVHAEHDLNPVGDAVTSYQASLDGGAPLSYPPVLNASCNCVKSPTFTVNDSNNHVISVVALNIWGTSPPATIAFKVTLASKVTNGTVKPGS